MTSYARIERKEGKFAVCEVELLSFEESKVEDFENKQVVMIDVPLHEIPGDIGEVNENDILVVEHNGENITCIYYKDDEERARRLEFMKTIL